MHVGIVYDPVFLKHDTGNHVENINRLVNIVKHLQETKLIDQLIPVPTHPATSDDLSSIHQLQHIKHIWSVSNSGGGSIDSETIISPCSYTAAVYAAGGAIDAAEAVMENEVDTAFAIVRPPGHHAMAGEAMGFCLFNNVAIAAHHILAKYHLERLAIIDFDVHHGNGTQAAFYSDPRVQYVSLHQHPLFPGTGNMADIGTGPATGTKINVPLPPGCGDSEYQQAFEQVVMPVVQKFKPQFILVSAGYDAHWEEDIAAMKISIQGFVSIVKNIKYLAAENCYNRLALVLEGGYHPQALAASVHATFEVLLGRDNIVDPLGHSPFPKPAPDIAPLLSYIRQIHGIE